MATQGRPPHPPVEPDPEEMPEIERLLRSEPSSFEFFQAVRLLGLLSPDRQPVGGFANPDREYVRFGANPDYTFPSSQISQLEWREDDQPRNFLSKIQYYSKVYDSVNSLSHLDDFAQTCLNIWERGAPFGIYNVTNPGAVTTRQVVAMIERILKPNRKFMFWKDDEEFYREGAAAPRSNCILDVSKVRATGLRMRTVHEALEESLRRWHVGSTAVWPARRPSQPIRQQHVHR